MIILPHLIHSFLYCRRCTQANDVADATETPNKTAFREHLENTITVLRKQNQELEARIHTMKQSMTQQSCRDGCDVEASSIRSQKHDSDADNRLYPYTARLAKVCILHEGLLVLLLSCMQ